MQSITRDNPKPYAIVVGLDCIQGLQSARILASYKIPVIAIASSPDYYSCKTNVCDEILYVKTSSQKLSDLLESLGPTFKKKPVLFPCQDKNVLVISRNREILEQWYHIVLPDPDVLEMLVDKVSFYTYADKEGFPIPSTFMLSSKEDAERAAAQIEYPSILKPPSRPGSWTKHTKLKGIVANNPEEFLAHYEHYHNWAEVLIAQKLIQGDDASHYTCNCYFDRCGEPIVTFTTRKLRQWRPKTGQACLSEEARNDVVVEETLRLFRSVGYRGLGYLEMKRDEQTGKHFIIEPNIGRPTGRAATAEAGGVELLYTMYCDAAGLPLPANRQQKFVGVKWIHLLRDLQAAFYLYRRGELTIREWWQSVRGHKVYAVFSWRDPLPFLAALYRAVPVLLSARERG